MESRRKHTILRVVAGTVLLVFLPIAIGFFWLMQPKQKVVGYEVSDKGEIRKKIVEEEPNYKQLLQTYIPKLIDKATNGEYHISFGDLNVDLPTNEIDITNLVVKPDSIVLARKRKQGTVANAYKVVISSIKVTGVVWLPIVKDKELRCDRILISHPRIVIDAYGGNEQTGKDGHDSGSAPMLSKITANKIQVQEPDITYNSKSSAKKASCYLKGGSIVLNQWQFSLDGHTDNNAFLFAKSGNIKLGTFEYKEPGNLYKISSSGVSFTTEKNTLTLSDFRIAPLIDNEEYYRRIGVQKEIYTIHLPAVQFTNFDWDELMKHNLLSASVMSLRSPEIDIYLSRYPPPNTQSKVTSYPGQLLRNLGVKVNIPKLNVNNGLVKYTELNKENNLSAHVTFNNIHGSITNVTNIASRLKVNSHCIARLAGLYKNKGDATATFDLHLTDPHGYFTMNGSLANLDAEDISDDSKALSMVEVKSLHIHRMDVTVAGNDMNTSGTITMRYNGLQVELEKINKHGETDDKHVSSWMANNIYIFPDNPMPKDDRIRSATTSVPRDRLRSFFNAIWANMREGVDKTVIKDQDIAEEQARITDGKKHKKSVFKGFFKSVFRKKAKR